MSNRIQITKKMIKESFDRGIISIDNNGDGPRAYIGNYWFYFGGSKYEKVDVTMLSNHVILSEIYNCLNNRIKKSDFDEYTYYYYCMKDFTSNEYSEN